MYLDNSTDRIVRIFTVIFATGNSCDSWFQNKLKLVAVQWCSTQDGNQDTGLHFNFASLSPPGNVFRMNHKL